MLAKLNIYKYILHNPNSFINVAQKYGKQLSLVTVKRINRKKSLMRDTFAVKINSKIQNKWYLI